MLCDNLEEWDGVGVGGRFKREGTYVYLWLIHVDIWQKPTQFCKEIILQLKINKFKKECTINAAIQFVHFEGFFFFFNFKSKFCVIL